MKQLLLLVSILFFTALLPQLISGQCWVNVVQPTQDTTIYLGDSIVLKAVGNCTNDYTASWNHGPTVLNPPPVYPTSTMTYKVTLADSIGNNAWDELYVIVIDTTAGLLKDYDGFTLT